MSLTTSYGYDLHGNTVKKTLPNGETVEQSFDALNRVTAIEGEKPSAGGSLYSYAYRYDLAGNVVFIREEYPSDGVREITQTYDRAYRLTTEVYRGSGGFLGSAQNRVVRYEYDLADNRTSKKVYASEGRQEYSYNTLNQLTTRTGAGTVSYEYDLNGNRITRTADVTTHYTYDYEQRLLNVTDFVMGYDYAYDYRTRRVRIVATPDVGPGGTTTTLSFSGGTSVQEYVDSTLNVEYIRGSDLGGGIGGILYTIRGGEPSFTHYNSRGDVVAKTNSGSTLTYQAAYEAYGTHSIEAGSTLDKQKANTKDEDPTELLNEGFRYRDLETGEFITRDPAGFVDGPNLYTYVRQNPWSKFDPRGLLEVDITDKQAAKLKPSNAFINNRVNAAIAKALRDAKTQKLTGEAAAKMITHQVSTELARPLSGGGTTTNDIKLSRELSAQGPTSVLKNPTGGQYEGAAWVALARLARGGDALAAGINIQVNGKPQGIGTDKIDHFFADGYTAYHELGDDIEAGRSWSSELEEGMWGLGVSGVYSNADIEATTSGQQFYIDLAESARKNRPFKFDIKNYKPQKWDENNNKNRHSERMKEIIKRNEEKSRYDR